MSQEDNNALIPSKNDLVKIISFYFPLNKSRQVLKANCPFHIDASQSFMVAPQKNLFKCFGCGIEGGPIQFIMAIEKMPFDEAEKYLQLHFITGKTG